MNQPSEIVVREPTEATPAADTMALLASGHLGKELQLTGDQLRVGLTVARNHLARGASAEALRIYVALVLCEPLNVDFQVGLSNCAGLIGEHHIALQAASAVIALAPTDPRGYLLSGRSCLMLGSFAEAKTDLEDAQHFARIAQDEAVSGEAGALLERLSAAMAS